MTGKYQEITITKEVTERKYTHTICDWCKKTINLSGKSVPDTSLRLTIVNKDYDLIDTREWCVHDLCIECMEKLTVLLESSGIDLAYTEDSWDCSA